jgi:hypothetical protein
VADEQLEARMQAVIDRLLVNTRFAQSPILPSYWLSAGIQNWAEGALHAAGFFVLVLFSHSLFLARLATQFLGSPFADAATQVQCRGSLFIEWAWFRRLELKRAAMTAELRDTFADLATPGADEIAINSRHEDALRRTAETLACASASLSNQTAPELVASDLRLALQSLESILGVGTSEDVLDRLFSQFCIGK